MIPDFSTASLAALFERVVGAIQEGRGWSRAYIKLIRLLTQKNNKTYSRTYLKERGERMNYLEKVISSPPRGSNSQPSDFQ